MAKELSFTQKLKLDLYARLTDKMAREHVLRTIFWECTLRCNAACRHCGSDCHVSSSIKDMPASDFLKVIDSVRPHVDPHKTFVIFTGGEPLVRNDLEAVGMELCKREFPWGIVTNGILLDKKRFASLRSCGMHSATVSLDGFEEDHIWMRGNPLAFKNAVNAISLMVQEPGFIFDVVTCANSRNFSSLPQLKEFLISSGVRQWRIFTVFPLGRAARDPMLQLSGEQFTELMEFIVKTREEGRISVSYGCEGFLGGYEGKVRDNFYICQAGLSVASILSDGSISACPSIRSDFYQGNIYHDDFWSAWQNGFKPYRNREWARKGVCADCKMFKYCRGNGMHLHDENGDLILCHYKRLTR